jgi:hypothetical protein
VDVVSGIEPSQRRLTRCREGLVVDPVREYAADVHHLRGVVHGQVAHPSLDDRLTFDPDQRGCTAQRVVAVSPGDLVEGDSGTRGQRWEERPDGDLVVVQ